MQKIALIGDCQSLRIYDHWDFKSGIDMVAWGKSGDSAYKFDPNLRFINDELSSPSEIYDKEKNQISFKKIKDEGIILMWLGYIDIKCFLPVHKNTKKVVSQYINKAQSYFKNSKLIFIEPFPQFIPYIGLKSEQSLKSSYEERKKYNDEFIQTLHNQFNGQIITQNHFFKELGFDQNDMTYDVARKDDDKNFADTFDQKNMKKIYELILSKAIN